VVVMPKRLAAVKVLFKSALVSTNPGLASTAMNGMMEATPTMSSRAMTRSFGDSLNYGDSLLNSHRELSKLSP